MTEKLVPITGGCLCGAVRYESTEDPATAATCHCRTCQKGYGGPYTAAVGFRRSAFSITKGELKYYESSKIARRGFCSECGSPILLDFKSFVPFGGEHFFVRMGSLDNPEKYKPEFHFGVEAQLPWIHFDDGLPRLTSEDHGLIEALATADRHDTP
jgi:hypothetical protein